MTVTRSQSNNAAWPDTYAIERDGSLKLAGKDATELAKKWGTPLYIFDECTIRNQCRSYSEALRKYYPGEFALHYASKAYLNTAIATLLKSEGLGFDAVSSGELGLALRAGVDPSAIHFHGNAKLENELKKAIELKVGSIIIDNLDEIGVLKRLCADAGKVQKVLIRITPDVKTETHPHIQTGQRTSKFGLPIEFLDQAVKEICTSSYLKLEGLHFHLGSQIEDAIPFVASLELVLDLYQMLKEKHCVELSEISPGGGLGVVYNDDDKPVSIDEFVNAVATALVHGCAKRNLKLPRLIMEPGRSIIARSCISLYSVISKKNISGTNLEKPIRYIHIDGGMGDNIRPSLYSAKYTARVANRCNDVASHTVNVSGRYCESGDVLLSDISMPIDTDVGDLIAVAGVGAYTLSMASTYNMVPRPAVLMVNRDGCNLIQRRETEDDMFGRDLEFNLA